MKLGYVVYGKLIKKKFDNFGRLDFKRRPTKKDFISSMKREAIKNLFYGFGLELFYEIQETYNFSILFSFFNNNVDSKKKVNENLKRWQLGLSFGYNFKTLIEDSIVKHRTRRLFTLKRIGS